MEAYLIYIAKAALAAGAFYLVYLALFQHQKHFLFNRIYLPVSLALSFLIPLITFTTVKYIEPIQSLTANSFAYLPETTQIEKLQFVFQWLHYLFGLYFLGAIGFLFHLLVGHFNAITIIRFSRIKQLFNAEVNITPKDVHPFSFFDKIVLSENTLDNPNLEVIVSHEKIHVDEKHTLDILFTEILFLLQWFNPFAWLIKDAIRNNLEYKTDHQITKNNNAEAYQLAMVGLVHKKGVAPFLTALNGSQLKNRIIMMKKKTENKYALLKQLVVLPLLAILVMGLSNKEVRTEIVQAKKEVKIVLDGNVIPTNHPALASINFTDGFDGGEISKALGVEDKIVSNTLAFDEDSENATYYLQTSAYTEGTNPEFDEQIGNKKTGEHTKPTETFYALNNKLVEKDEFEKIPSEQIELPVILTAEHASKKYREKVKNGLVIDVQTVQEKQKDSVKGKVTDEKGAPVSGVAILIKDTKTGTITDREGNYFLEAESAIKSLQVVMKGYVKQEVVVKDNPLVNIVLKADADTNSDAIKVIGYGEVKPNSPAKAIKLSFPTNGDKSNQPLFVVDGKETEDIESLAPDDIESISVLKDKSATSLYGDKGKNGVVIITSKEAANKKLKKALIIVDGKKFEGDVSDIDPENIEKIDVLKNESASKLYGNKAKDGAITITTKNKLDFGANTPLIYVDGVKSDKDVNDIDPENIASISVLKDASATELYGEKGKNGVILITTKSAVVEITSELELRKFIAKKIKYPLRPREDNIEGTAKVYIKVLNDGTINYVSDEEVKDAVLAKEVVVVAYKSEEKETKDKLDNYDKYFRTELKRVIYQLSKLDIEEYKGKTLAITAKFVLQDKN